LALVRRHGAGTLVELVARIGANPAESDDERVRRLIWATTLVCAEPLLIAMAMAYAALGSPVAASIVFAWVMSIVGQLLLFGVRRRGLDSIALASQLSCVLVSFVGVVSLGGPTRSGGFVMFGLIGPFYALVFPSRRRAAWVFVAYLASIVAGVVLADHVPWARPLSPLVNLVSFGFTLASISVFIFVTLYYFVRERDRVFGLLREAQERISRLLESSPGASETMPQWSRSLAEEIAAAIGADAIGIWELAKERLTEISDGGLLAPSLDELKGLMSAKGRSLVATADRTIVPLTGMGGELCGAVVISGRSSTWGESGRRLVVGFTHQLGAVLDMSRMRRELAAAEERRAASRRGMQERGISTLQICPKCGCCYDHTVATCAIDGARLESPRTLPYRLLDRYRFLRVLGQGGMGTVLAAQDEKLGREVAVKLIRPEHFNEPEPRRRFEREAQTVARIQHPGVIALYDSGEVEDGGAFLVMEKLAGRDLASLIRAYGPGNTRQVATLVRQGCAALGAAHRAGVVHRDVKPANVFLVDDPSGFRVKVLDFGLAKSMTLEEGLTQTGAVIGTPTYMSPEQVRGEEVDARSDVYSFAVVCYEALTGEKAASGGDLGRILINVLSAVPPAVSALVPGLPPEVDAAFSAALAKDQARRPKDIELWGSSFVEALEMAPADPTATGWPGSRGDPGRLLESPISEAITLAGSSARTIA
jgi:tRNA A-37 threonylcarbamoyl transferase component Bud32